MPRVRKESNKLKKKQSIKQLPRLSSINQNLLKQTKQQIKNIKEINEQTQKKQTNKLNKNFSQTIRQSIKETK